MYGWQHMTVLGGSLTLYRVAELTVFSNSFAVNWRVRPLGSEPNVLL